MKKVALIFVVFLICLACFNSMVGANNRKYGETVQAVVGVVNNIGHVSGAVLDLLLPGGVDVSCVSDLPEYYQSLFQNLVRSHGCNGACSSQLEYYIRNVCYSDARAYYLGECTYFQSIRYEGQVLNVYFSWFVNDKEAAREMYEAGVLGGYPMDNPALAGPGLYSDDFIEFICPYVNEVN